MLNEENALVKAILCTAVICALTIGLSLILPVFSGEQLNLTIEFILLADAICMAVTLVAALLLGIIIDYERNVLPYKPLKSSLTGGSETGQFGYQKPKQEFFVPFHASMPMKSEWRFPCLQQTELTKPVPT